MKRRRGTGPHGVLLVDKPAGPTSHDVVRRVRSTLETSRVGHAGTLDPAATGLLVVLVGEATKLSDWLMEGAKAYEAWIALGQLTDTLDAQGEVLTEAPVPSEALSAARVQDALTALASQETQVPPRYAAIKRGGRSLMSRARAGEEFEPEPRPVVCHGLTLKEVDAVHARVRVDVRCGKGYYVRALARDLGEALGGLPAHLFSLRRTESSGFDVSGAVPLESVDAERLVAISRALSSIPSLAVSAEDARRAGHGLAVPATEGGPERALLIGPGEVPIAMARREGATWRVVRGFRFTPDPEDAAAPGA